MKDIKDLNTSEIHQNLVYYSNVYNSLSSSIFPGNLAEIISETKKATLIRHEMYFNEFKGREDAHIYEPNINKGLSGIQGASNE
jgi:hypothetical protein